MEKILVIPNPKLRQKSDLIKNITKKELDIAKKMIEVLRKVNGVGLAANQLGILKQIIAVKIKDSKNDKEKIYVLFNPKIRLFSKETVKMEEGCLSIPEQFAEVERPASVEIEYTNEKNQIIFEKKIGYEARILQHEIDHLYGKLFVDYLSSLKRNIMIKRVKKLSKMDEI